jgi:hypothetical protein
VLLGVLYEADGSLVFAQHVFDERLWPAAACFSLESGKGSCVADGLAETLDRLIDLSNRERRHVVSWSTYDRAVIRSWSSHQAFRYRNAIPTARRWRAGRSSLHPGDEEVVFEQQDLGSYLRFIGYEVPEEVRHGAGAWIANVRERLANADGSYEAMSPGGKRDSQRLLEHNRHDCFGMREVMLMATGVE